MNISLMIICLISLLLGGCQKQQAVSSRPLPYVKTAPAIAQDVPLYIDAIAVVEAYSTLNIVPRVSGQITACFFESGQEVAVGDPLFTIDTRPYQAALDQSKASLQQARAQLKYHQLAVESYQNLVADNFVAPLQFQEYLSSALVSQAQVQQHMAEVEQNQLNVDFCSISSPIKGKTGKQLIDTGNIVLANQTNPLVVINQITPIYIDFSIPEKLIPTLLQYAAKQPLPVWITVPEKPGKTYIATLVFYDNQVNTNVGTFALRAQYPNEEKELWPGQFANARIVLTTLKEAVLIPLRAVQTNAEGDFVFVLGQENIVAQKKIVCGQTFATNIVVEKGLRAGDVVITEGSLNLKNGSIVQVKS